VINDPARRAALRSHRKMMVWLLRQLIAIAVLPFTMAVLILPGLPAATVSSLALARAWFRSASSLPDWFCSPLACCYSPPVSETSLPKAEAPWRPGTRRGSW
jgi:hypothetical protein